MRFLAGVFRGDGGVEVSRSLVVLEEEKDGVFQHFVRVRGVWSWGVGGAGDWVLPVRLLPAQ